MISPYISIIGFGKVERMSLADITADGIEDAKDDMEKEIKDIELEEDERTDAEEEGYLDGEEDEEGEEDTEELQESYSYQQELNRAGVRHLITSELFKI